MLVVLHALMLAMPSNAERVERNFPSVVTVVEVRAAENRRRSWPNFPPLNGNAGLKIPQKPSRTIRKAEVDCWPGIAEGDQIPHLGNRKFQLRSRALLCKDAEKISAPEGTCRMPNFRGNFHQMRLQFSDFVSIFSLIVAFDKDYAALAALRGSTDW
ncbi:hypothetical protein [Burkholderia lata]|uniref:hypothetical protein n=1 Tax=Burkholderia lata (strain ATCC 17760 / DSM 23089 / LMG 22485 / NCIMB 9086 / R18194 / 383) TaxID=482957 RepID=UPI001582C841|nr:hypothetical protein [Burkholderia lata]